MININDIVGKTFGKITVLSFIKKGKRYIYYYYYYDCIDDSGKKYILTRNQILNNGKSVKCRENIKDYTDIIGKKIGKYNIISLNHIDFSSNYDYYYKCKCGYCNKEFIAKRKDIIRGKYKSCGCMLKEFISQANGTHHMTNTRFYNIYVNMKTRCYNPKAISYSRYGGRGIKICDRWLESFENFRDDMYDSYLEHAKLYGESNTTIDRINVNGNYCPENCRWATYKFQGNNMRKNHIVNYNGEKLTISQLVDKYADSNLSYGNVLQRINNNWSPQRAISELPNTYRQVKIEIPVIFHDMNKCPVIFY